MGLTVHHALHQGVTAHKEGKLQEAERFYRIILKTQPTHPDANHNLGIIAVSLDKPEVALPLFKIALEVSPATEQFWYSYIDTLIKARQFKKAQRVIKKAKKSGGMAENLTALEKQLTATIQEQAKSKLKPLRVPSLADVNSMIASYQSGESEKARDLALYLTKKYPEHVVSWQVRGLVFEQLGQLDNALISHHKAVQLDPEDANSHSNLGNIQRVLGKLPEAEVSCRQAIKLKPNFAVAFSNLGNALKDLGQLEQAEASYRQAITLNADYAEAYSNLGVTLIDLSRLLEAEKSCRQAIALKPDFVVAHDNLGLILTGLGRLEQAEVSCRQAITLKPDYAKAHNNLGNILKERGRFLEAEASFKHAIALDPDLVEATYSLGRTLYECGHYQKAIEQFSLVDFGTSKSDLLRCLYRLDQQSNFYEQLDYLLNQGVNNAVIGSLISRSEIRYGIKKTNPFCNEPLKYVVKTNLSQKCDFNTIFIKGATDILSDERVQHKSQGLLTNGIQTAGNVFSQCDTVTEKIQKTIRLEIEKYRVNFKDSQEGLITNWPADYSLYGWFVSMKNGGELAAHMHEEGWISGSIYINVPPKSKRDSGNLVVCIEEGLTSDNEDQVQSIDVVTGDLCLFPASLLHYTMPFESKEDRIVLAFDVRPNNLMGRA